MCTLIINPRQANWGWIGPWTPRKSGGVAYSSKPYGSLNPCDFGRLQEGEWRIGTFTLGAQRKSRQSFRVKATFFPPSLSSCFVPSFFPQTETQMKWKKISTEIRVKMKYNHSFVLMTNIQKASSLFQKLARNWKAQSLLSNWCDRAGQGFIQYPAHPLYGKKERKVQGSEEVCSRSPCPGKCVFPPRFRHSLLGGFGVREGEFVHNPYTALWQQIQRMPGDFFKAHLWNGSFSACIRLKS